MQLSAPSFHVPIGRVLLVSVLLLGCIGMTSRPAGKGSESSIPADSQQALLPDDATPLDGSSAEEPVVTVALVSGVQTVGHRRLDEARRLLTVHFGGEKTTLAGVAVEQVGWQPLVDPAEFGRARYCWQQGGLAACERGDAVFQMAEGDLVNLVPVRSGAELKADSLPAPVRGRLARIRFYMHERYDWPLSAAEHQELCHWAGAYPVDDWERARNREIARWQGSANPFVDDPRQLALRCA
ncbi:endonuclease [Crenobacter sp. SG2303]|uniref:Endonuclease n=1 Tax=Crenobacter oryzisoli TaxID=3056844 RepID=A0ABT7XU09_9NEIS|nr:MULTISPECIES: endonuclease [unclassified Crenobacter]MDN0077280.1 endonuclease [Crenobacter sp. SG2303]MDN0082158.1 endonuclease [Crenobacter sp. SG2305]